MSLTMLNGITKYVCFECFVFFFSLSLKAKNGPDGGIHVMLFHRYIKIIKIEIT